ncbi:MAG: aminopeptidase [Verrucomicrobia bacterium]|jgi:hypothetical protein|nr:aminopeptidase [Verrucomicrobiota bacterium]
MKANLLTLGLLCLCLVGCAKTRSISNSGFNHGGYHAASAYDRELQELDVLGLDQQTVVSEKDIQDALNTRSSIQLKRGSTIMLVQSGSEYPDPGMVENLGKHFSVVPFSGLAPVPVRKNVLANGNVAIPVEELGRPKEKQTEQVFLEGPDYSRLLRLAAARSGSESVVCYWGILESASEGLATKTVSWVPVVNWMLPDERQHMRIRLRIAVLDVRSGNWTMLMPEAFEDKKISTTGRREAADQKQVEALKKKAYEAGAKEVLQLAANR